MTSFFFQDYDLEITSSDGILFHVHKQRMSQCSPVFADMFSMPTPSASATTTLERKLNGTNDNADDKKRSVATVELTESSDTLEDLLHFVYETDQVKPGSITLFDRKQRFMPPIEEYQRFSALFEASCKYEIETAQTAAVAGLTSLLSHRALRAPIEDLASRLDHPNLAALAKHYESIELNRKLRAAAKWRTSSRGYMWRFWALCWVLAVVSIIKLAVSLHIHISLHRFIFPACQGGAPCPHQTNVEFKLSIITACVSLFLAPIYCCVLVASQPIDRTLLRSLIVVAWLFWLLDCIYSGLHLRASRGKCHRVTAENAEYFADCSLTSTSLISLSLSFLCLFLSTPQFASVLYWFASVIYQQWLLLASIPRRAVSLQSLPELKAHSL